MPREPELRQLRTFVVVAEELHFTRAAARLNIAQQALSTQIHGLEQRLGVTLFDRTTRRVELTEAGRTLLAHAMPLLAAATRAWMEVSATQAGEAGQLSVSYAPTARREALPAVLAEVHRRYPQLELKLCELLWGCDALTSGLADVAIVRGPVPDDSRIAGAQLRQSVLGVVLGRRHPLAAGDVVGVAELAGLALEISARRFTPGFHDAIVHKLHDRGFDGAILEYENLGSRILLDDEAACARIVRGETFGVSFENQYATLPSDLIWLRIEPELLVPLTICWRDNSGVTVTNFVTAALQAAYNEGWISAPPPDPANVPTPASFMTVSETRSGA